MLNEDCSTSLCTNSLFATVLYTCTWVRPITLKIAIRDKILRTNCINIEQWHSNSSEMPQKPKTDTNTKSWALVYGTQRNLTTINKVTYYMYTKQLPWFNGKETATLLTHPTTTVSLGSRFRPRLLTNGAKNRKELTWKTKINISHKRYTSIAHFVRFFLHVVSRRKLILSQCR